MARLKRFVEIYPWTTVAGVFVAAVLVLTFGCAAKIVSPISGKEVNEQEFAYEVAVEEAAIQQEAAQLDARVGKLIAAGETGFEQFAQKKAAWQALLDGIQSAVVTAAGPYAPLALLGFGVLSTGLGLDNLRKDGVIKGNKIALKQSRGL